ncbi:MAG TPA: MBL fold metallo-hydrolase [Chthoniobacterales bacterium]|nr:MBL fold metallo-hydrolase [Chthoniobacterales bacterium]
MATRVEVESKQPSVKPSYRNRRVRRWASYLWREAILESWKPIKPPLAKPNPVEWSDARLTAAWLGHSTVLINFLGIKILTDPVLFPRIGIRIPFLFTLGPKRLTRPALKIDELPKIDVVLLSHAHFDHMDWRTLSKFGRSTKVITARNTRDLLNWTRLRNVTELDWGEKHSIETEAGGIKITAVAVQHWGARMQHDDHRGYNAYLIERNNRRVLFGGDSAFTDRFIEVRRFGSVDLAIFSIAAYNPWIRTHADPEQAIQMADDAGARFIMPVHHQTFRLSFEPFREPIERFEAALRDQPERIALREIGETFVLPD